MNFDRIQDDLYVGQKIVTEEFRQALIDTGITHVLNLHGLDLWQGKQMFLAGMLDDSTPRTKEQVNSCIWYAKDVRDEGGKLYVHCQWGLGRAPAMCYAILRSRGFGGLEAAGFINRNRPRAAEYRDSTKEFPHWQCYIPSIEAAL